MGIFDFFRKKEHKPSTAELLRNRQFNDKQDELIEHGFPKGEFMLSIENIENNENGIYVSGIIQAGNIKTGDTLTYNGFITFNDKELNLRDKIWAQVKHMYDNKTETNLYITQGSELGDKLAVLQRGYKASNNEDYAEIVNIMQMDWGFFDDKKRINIDSLVKQYRSGDVINYCERRNLELIALRNKEGYVMKPDDLEYVCYGQIDKWPITLLYELLYKLNINYTKQSLNNELEYSNEFVKKYARCQMKNGETCAAWCRKEDTPTHKFISQQEEEFFNESQGSNDVPF